jgi:hypothetical protein
VHWSLPVRYQARLSDPRYDSEEMILPDVTESPMYSTDDAWDGAVTVTDELSNQDDMEELDTRMGDAEANEDDDMEQEQLEDDSQEQDDSEEHARLRSFLRVGDFE